MNELALWVIQISLSTLDFVMLYFIVHALVKRRIKLNVQDILWGMGHVLISALSFRLLDGHLARAINILTFVFVIKYMFKRNFADTVTFYAISFVVSTVQLPVAVVVSLFSLQQELLLLLIQLLTFPFVLLICKYAKPNKLFNAIQANLMLKQILLILTFIFLMIAFIMNFEYGITYLLISLTGFFLIGLALIPLIMKLYRQSLGMMSVHDLKNNLLSIGIAMENMHDIDVLKHKFREHAKQFGMDLAQLDLAKTEHALDQMERINRQVELFIDQKVTQHRPKSQIVSDITYYKDYERLDLQKVLEWLGTLLDNALEASHAAPIYVYLYSGIKRVTLKVSNEYLGNKGDDIIKIFEKGYSKKGEGRGIGLHHLNASVKEKGGKVDVEAYYHDKHRCHYLELSIYFKSK
ncbi:MAG: GHKL domain-containing protein [Defluviitaleaceae bacterium]|nr:GHKL domain-containing protein [Defluviitaleaceae bacterium]